MPLDPSSVLLTDRVAIVTGAAVGIGEAVATALARFGADVAICDRDVPNLDSTADAIEAAGRRVVAGELDVRDGDQVANFLGVVQQQLGHVDVLVNNAGGGFYANFLDVNDKGQDALVRENFVSVTNFVRGVVPLFPGPPRGGSIVNLTSIEAHRAAPGYGVYSAMKAGVASLTKTLALELGDRMIRVNCIAPDVIPTPGIGGEMEVKTPLPRPGHVDDIAAAAVFLAGDLSSFVTGTTIHVDGGNLAAGGWHRLDDGSFGT
ncbi:MAG TPA: SDR family oxidoreductase [Acidimicrobiia bacterium]|nr:SDR family oxidoreductase [Acidimicrobiia bacterium]